MVLGPLILLPEKQEKEGIQDNRSISLNLNELGYEKILGEGEISIPVEIKVKSCSKSALEKIEKSGGKVILEKA